MLFSYNWLQSFFQKKLPKPEKLVEFLTMKAFEVAEIKKVNRDYILDIDVLSNRGADCFSHIGMAREIAAITNLKFKIQDLKLKENKNLKAKDFIKIKVEDKNDCFRYTGRVVTNVKVGPSSKQIQERLKACGLRPINNIVDIANYVMLETGQPLHAFDFDKIKGENSRFQAKKIIVRRAKKGEKIITLDNEEYILDRDILVIADEENPLAIAGIKGGKKAEIDKKTKNIVLESANFNSKTIRKSSKKIQLRTDASWRFEHKIDPNLTEIAVNKAAVLIKEIAGGEISSGVVDFYPKKVLPKKIKLDLNYVEKLLGVKIPVKEIKKILKRLNFKIKKSKTSGSSLRFLEIEVPSFRLDIFLPQDLIEEIGRIYGYQKIPAAFPLVSLIPPKKNFEIFWEETVKNFLKELGFTEVYNYSFINREEMKFFGFEPEEVIEVKNPVSSEQEYLRPSLIPKLLKNVKDNIKYFNEIKIFELGKIFGRYPEKKMLTGLMTGNTFYRLKGVIDSLLNKLGISNIWYDSYQQTPEESKFTIWHPERSAEIKVNSEEIGFLGEISPALLKKLKIDKKIIIFDVDFEKLKRLCCEEHEYRPISQYPAAVRDIAVLVPVNVKVAEVLNRISVSGGKLVRDVDLFDIYEGTGIPEGKKNLAFHIVYQAENRTLTSEEIDKIQNKIIKTLESEVDWQVRR